MIATRTACAYDYQRIQIRTDTGQLTEQMANPTQRTSVALPPFKLHKIYFSVLVLLKCRGNGSGGCVYMCVCMCEAPMTNPAEISPAEAKQTTSCQCVVPEWVYRAIALCICLQLQSTSKMLDGFRSGK